MSANKLILLVFLIGFVNVVRCDILDNPSRDEEYDYIIVGGGSAGTVVASRLSERSNLRVLLLEAGGEPPTLGDIPIMVSEILNKSGTEWGYYTVPQEKACFGSEGNKSFWTRYKALGGCSAHNFMVYNRGDSKDYDHWEEQGCTGWSWRDVLPFFIKSENNTDPQLAQSGLHGHSGYLTVSRPRYESILREAYLDAAEPLGYQVTPDYNDGKLVGFSSLQMTQRDGLRCSTEKAFIRPAENRNNLDIVLNAQVTKILFNKKTARSVAFHHKDKSYSVCARKEIIISAGAIGTPHLLLLSGIGPKLQLKQHGIPVVMNLPVGLNLQDHLSSLQIWQLNSSVGYVKSRDLNAEAWAAFNNTKTGILTSPGGLENIIYVNTKYQSFAKNWTDIQIHATSDAAVVTLPPEYDNRDITTHFQILSRPKSRGFVKLVSKDPYVHPIIDPKYLHVEDDFRRLVEAVKFSRKIIKTPGLEKYGPEPILAAIPNCQHLNWSSEEYIKCSIRSTSFTIYHPCCTAKMGKPDDPTTVVDPQLRVKGVKGLRVADASVMPTIVSGNTNAPCIMIGEKAADMILKHT